MSRKRNVENADMLRQWSMESCLEHDDKEVDEILQSRKIKKRDKDEVIGFCDICEKLTAVTLGNDHSQVTSCMDCKMDELTFCTKFLKVKTDGLIIEEAFETVETTQWDVDMTEQDDSDLKSTCLGCASPFQPNCDAHMDMGGCLTLDE